MKRALLFPVHAGIKDVYLQKDENSPVSYVTVEQIRQELDEQLGGKAKICKLDADDEPAIAQRFGVMSIPTLMVFRNGEMISKEVGVHTVEQLMTMLG